MGGYARLMARQVASRGRARDTSVGIVGGGLLGLGIADELAAARRARDRLRVADAASGRPRRAAPTLGGVRVDRYYHAVTTTDQRVARPGRGARAERSAGARSACGFYHDGRLGRDVDARAAADVPRPAAGDQRAARAAFVLRCRRDRRPRGARRRAARGVDPPHRAATACGSACGAPLLDSKFDGHYDDLPATYLWSRMSRTAGTRDRKGREVMGWIEGGYQALVDRLARAHPRAAAARSCTSTPVRFVPCARPAARSASCSTPASAPHDTVVTTQLRPNLPHMLAPELERALGPDPPALPRHRLPRRARQAAASARTTRSTSPTAGCRSRASSRRRTSSTPTAAGGSPALPAEVRATRTRRSSRSPRRDIRSEYLGHLQTIFPSFHEEDVIAAPGRARPRRRAGPPGRRALKPDPFAVPGLAVASSAQVYPDIVHGQAILGVAERIAGAGRPAARSQRRLEAA